LKLPWINLAHGAGNRPKHISKNYVV